MEILLGLLVEKMSSKRCINLFFYPAVWYFEHNSFVFENLLMGLAVLESLFYGLTVWCFEFLHLKGRKIVNRVWRASVFLDSGFWNCDFCEMIWEALKRFLGINFRMACSFFDVLSGK